MEQRCAVFVTQGSLAALPLPNA